MIAACDLCLRRAHLVARLAPRIAGLLDRPRRSPSGLLALEDGDLIAALGGAAGGAAESFLRHFDPAGARALLDERAVGAICRHDDRYPAGLRDLPDQPAVLFLRGRPERLAWLMDAATVALVGTRSASPYGLEVAHMLGRGLGAARVPVVSGMALGIDAAAHRGCLEGGGRPVAVLAGGPDIPYPRRHRSLFQHLCDRGLVVSEMPPGQEAFRWSFPARNRLMAGLAGMTVVVEAADPSGSLITAEFAQDLGRIVGAVPNRVTSRVAAGSNSLLRDGAAVVRCTEDVLDELFGAGGYELPPVPDPSSEDGLEPALRRVLDAVEGGDGIEAIGSRAGLPARAARAALGRLEALGHVRRSGLGGFERTTLGA